MNRQTHRRDASLGNYVVDRQSLGYFYPHYLHLVQLLYFRLRHEYFKCTSGEDNLKIWEDVLRHGGVGFFNAELKFGSCRHSF